MLKHTLGKGASEATLEEALAALLEVVGTPAVLVKRRRHRIVAANLAAVRQSAYTREHLTRLSVEQLFPDLAWEAITLLNGAEVSTFLQRRDGQSEKVVCRGHAVDSDGRYWVVLFSPMHLPYLQDALEGTAPRELVLEKWVAAWEVPDQNTAFRAFLEGGNALLGATWGALYLLEGASFQLQRGAGPLPQIPLTVPLHCGANIASCLGLSEEPQQAAAEAVVTFSPYTAIAPLGNSQAMRGFVVFGASVPLVDSAERRVALAARYAQALVLRWQREVRLKAEKNQAARGEAVAAAFLRAAREGVLVFDRSLALVDLNTTAMHLLGFAREEALGHPLADLLVSETLLDVAAREVVAVGRERGMEVHLLRRDGTEFPAEVRLAPYGTTEDDFAGVVVLITDLSQEEQYREQAQRLLRRAMLGDILASFAHEVRNPLNSISTGLEWLAFSLESHPEAQQTLRDIQQDLERLEHLVRNLLDYSRARPLRLRPLDVSAIIGGIFQRWRGRFEQSRIAAEYHVEPDVPPVCGDALSLEQVFSNLIDNAIRMLMRQEGERFIVVRVRRVKSEKGTPWVEINVVDNGPGFSEEVGRRLFEPFFTTREKGTGLGLAITKQLVTAHRGSLDAWSYPHGGAVFRVRLRAVQEEDAMPHHAGEAHSPEITDVEEIGGL